ncbi:TIGR03086 family metal-binding protein [Kribbella sp. NPDC000426]|uniref:TIGR03086 family metal-binding protein n=1 Tax=Kribbella sp. NPDC000426 TaxID=3154255 RepID=UPI0033307E34
MTFAQQLRDYAASLDWVSGLIAGTAAEDLGRPTPCSEWDVRLLIGHLIGTAYRGRGTATGLPASDVPHVVTDVPDDKLAATYAQLAAEIGPAFASFEGGTSVRAPWGQVTALEAVRGFTIETTTHGWDLAVATDRPGDAPPGVAERCLASAADAVPARLRGLMYADPLTDDPQRSPTERLARLLGHH